MITRNNEVKQGTKQITQVKHRLEQFSLASVLLLYAIRLLQLCGFPGSSVVKNPPVTARDTGSVPGLGRSPGEGNSTPVQYPCLENSMDRGAWWATVHRVAKALDTTERLSTHKLLTWGKQKHSAEPQVLMVQAHSFSQNLEVLSTLGKFQ